MSFFINRRNLLATAGFGIGGLLLPGGAAMAQTLLGLTGWAYGGTAITLGVIFMVMAWNVYRSSATLAADMVAEKKLFKFSLLYLACLFGALVADVLLLP